MLTSKQKSYLRSLAQTEPALFQIGKEGLSDNLIQTVDDALRTHELVKIKLLKTVSDDVDEIIFDLAMNTKSEVVQKIGRVFVLYRKAKEPKIILP
ncbi:MAG: ribosome assembly RNA-binding protein YhbY [Bulleidia sp.]|nr:ribosome assembly RNA-binding protein YhbY [Erysipelotrichaceae bacterium]MDY2781118.1 ribosome assembly RNA-binding protein YhbY [Bulleidia sp.]